MQVINSNRLLMHALSGNVAAILQLSRINYSACTKGYQIYHIVSVKSIFRFWH